jgi:hypothetical protein
MSWTQAPSKDESYCLQVGKTSLSLQSKEDGDTIENTLPLARARRNS